PPERLVAVDVRGDMPESYVGRPMNDWFSPGDPAPSDWRLTLFPLDCTVRGIVRDPDGAPVASAHVGFELGNTQREARSVQDGSFALRAASGQRRRVLCAWLEGFAQARAEFEALQPAEERTCDLVLGRAASVRGRVRDRSGAPLAGASVSLQNQSTRR